ncbi:hypothetical protein Lsed01_00864 [Demequina sediminis]|uniref:Uncharacterized protein n=1 Tax=Demequina sediminis TaxID=1930058 RepID=A0ABP9WF49_9MICO|nr:hypothetical protein [Demequina sediminis]BDZ62482.1 hypothetical protein GCM10025873_22730 [Demequina sediminis]
MTATITELRPAKGVRADKLRTHIEPLKDCIEGVAKRLDTLPERPGFYNATTPANPDELTLFAEPGVTADISINVSEALERDALIADIIKVINDVPRNQRTRTLVITPGSRAEVQRVEASLHEHHRDNVADAIFDMHEVRASLGVTNWRTLTTREHVRRAYFSEQMSWYRHDANRMPEKNNLNVVVLDADRQYQAEGAQEFLKELGNYANVTLTVVTAKSGVTLSATNKFTVQVGTGTWMNHCSTPRVELFELWEEGDYGKRLTFPDVPTSTDSNANLNNRLHNAIMRAAEGHVNPELLNLSRVAMTLQGALMIRTFREAPKHGYDSKSMDWRVVILANLDIVSELVRATVTLPEVQALEVQCTTQFLSRAA